MQVITLLEHLLNQTDKLLGTFQFYLCVVDFSLPLAQRVLGMFKIRYTTVEIASISTDVLSDYLISTLSIAELFFYSSSMC